MKEVQYIFFKEKVQIFNIQKNILYQVPNLSVYQKKKKKERKRKYQIYPKKRANIFKIRKGYELEIMKGSDGIVFLNPS